jgi:hypothetical protein
VIEALLAERVMGVPYAVLAVIALGIAAIFAVFEINTAGLTGWRGFAIRWFHSLCWMLLCIAALLKTRLLPGAEGYAGFVAAAGGAVYATYVAAMLVGRD